jgi:hypothetical protein
VSESLEVRCRPAEGGWTCHTSVGEGSEATHHDVRVSSADLERLSPAASEPDRLVRESFGFLLEREPKESILRTFALPEIGRYFPDYEGVIRSRLG